MLGQVACLCLLAEITMHQSRFDEIQSWLGETETLTAAHGDQSLPVQTLGTATRVSFTNCDYTASAALAEHMLALCWTIGHREGEAEAHARLAVLGIFCGA